MGKVSKVNKTNKAGKETINKSMALMVLSYLMMVVAFVQIIVVGLQIVYYYKMHQIGQSYSWLVIINETVIFAFISIFEMLMGVYGKKGANGDRYSLKVCRSFAILAVALTTVYVMIAVRTKSEETSRLISQFIYPLAFYFATFIPNFISQMEKDAKMAKDIKETEDNNKKVNKNNKDNKKK